MKQFIYTILSLLLFLLIPISTTLKAQVTVSASSGFYEFANNQKSLFDIYLGYDNLYAQYYHGIYNQINGGLYYKDFHFSVGVRKNAIAPSITYEKWLGNNTVRGFARYNFNNVETEIYTHRSSVLGVGYGYYFDKNRMSFDVLHELNNQRAWILVTKYRYYVVDKWFIEPTYTINHYRDHSYYAYTRFYIFQLSGGYNTNFDYTSTSYSEITFGIFIQF